jgi:hypothetical protein
MASDSSVVIGVAVAGRLNENARPLAENALAGLREWHAVTEGLEELRRLLADAGRGQQIVHDGPALAVKHAFLGPFVVQRRIVARFEKFALAEPGALVQYANMVVDGLSDNPAFGVQARGGVELGEAFLQPKCPARAVVLEEGVHEFVRHRAFTVGTAPEGHNPILIGAGLIEAGRSGRGAESGIQRT